MEEDLERGARVQEDGERAHGHVLEDVLGALAVGLAEGTCEKRPDEFQFSKATPGLRFPESSEEFGPSILP